MVFGKYRGLFPLLDCWGKGNLGALRDYREGLRSRTGKFKGIKV